MSRTLKDSNLIKSINEKSFLFFAYKVLGYPKVFGKCDVHFPYLLWYATKSLDNSCYKMISLNQDRMISLGGAIFD